MSWFKKQPKPEPPSEAVSAPTARVAPDQPTSQAVELIRRWDAMIADMQARLLALLDEAVAGSEPLIDAIRTDLTPVVLPWNTIGPRVREACAEVSEFWNKISDEMSECDGFTHEMMRREGSKRDLANCELELLHERLYGTVMARAADRMREAALQTDVAATRATTAVPSWTR